MIIRVSNEVIRKNNVETISNNINIDRGEF